MKLRLLEGKERLFLTADVEIIIDREKTQAAVAISETDGEDALLGKYLPGFNDILMTTSHDRAGITTSI